jgi:glycosyltransferase involved in cell wall biosynthesis
VTPNKPLSVLHISSGNLYGGVENTLSLLARQHHWDERLARHFALSFTGRLSDEIASSGVEPTLLGSVRLRYPWQIVRARSRLRSLLRQERFDAVICHMIWSLLIFGPSAQRENLPLIFWMHDVATGQHWLERLAGRVKPDLAIVNSRFTAATLSHLFPKPPPHVVIHPPAMPPRAGLTAVERAEVRAQLDTPLDSVVIIQVGRMESYKGHELHLDALARLKEVPGWTCWIVGGAQRPQERLYFANLQKRAAAAGVAERVRFAGERRDVARLLGAADIFCQPNIRGEPFGVVFSEALYAGIPVVATAIGGALEIIDESCGRLVPPHDIGALANTLRDLITNPALRAELGRAGPARGESLSHPDLILTRLEAAVHQAVEIHSRSRKS